MKSLHLFLLLTFGLFTVGFAIAGALIALDSPDYLVTIVQIVMAWTPTAALAIVHRRNDPGRSFIRYVASAFAGRIRIAPFLASVFIPLMVTAVVWIGLSVYLGKDLVDLVASFSFGGLVLLFLDNLIRGPLGEELGWRGYLLGEFNKRLSLLASSLIVGVIWGAWHLPLWFVSGYQGVNLLLYI